MERPGRVEYLSPVEAKEQGDSPQHRFDLMVQGERIGAAEIDYFSKPIPLYQLTDLYVDARYKGQGNASQILEQVESFLKERGRPGVLVDAIMPGDPAAGLYARRGWREVPGSHGLHVFNWPEDVLFEVLQGYPSRYTHPLDRKNFHAEISKVSVETEEGFEDFIPEDLERDPFEYFEREGRNVKLGEILYAEDGSVREDLTAVKDFPLWENSTGETLAVVGKRVNAAKSRVGASGNPFYEYEVMEEVARRGLPGPRPICKASDGERHVFFMEKIPGVRWSEKGSLRLKEAGYSDKDIESLMDQATKMMRELEVRFQERGILRKWKLQDMVFDIDVPEKKIIRIIPTDWERTKVVSREG